MNFFFRDIVNLCYNNFISLLNYYRDSVSSKKFYQNIYLHYEGYGFRYIFLTALVSSICLLPFIFYKLNNIKSYLYYQNNENISNLNFILNQFDGVEYTGNTIEYKNNNYLFVKDLSGKNVILIDPDNKYQKMHDAKLILNKYQIRLQHSQKNIQNVLHFKYKNLFGKNYLTFNHMTSKHFYDFIKQFLNIIPYLFIFIYSGSIFIHHILSNIAFILFFYFITRLFVKKIHFSTAVRLVMFSSGLQLLFYSSIVIIFPVLHFVAKIIGYISTVLLMSAMMRYKNN